MDPLIIFSGDGHIGQAFWRHRSEIEMLDEIGASKMMFGADIPHPEATWPNSKQWIADAFQSVSEEKLRMVLGENAIGFYNLDRAAIEKTAARLAVKAARSVHRRST